MYKLLFFPFQWLFILCSTFRKCLYKLHILKRHTYNIPIICFGNLSSGGTGKTPHVKHFAYLLNSEGFHVAILLRGYRRKTKGIILCTANHTFREIGDEAVEYVRSLPPDIPVVVARNRHRGIQFILNNYPETDVILMDDGYQHLRVKADLYILLTDFHQPYFNDHVLPVGSLRETKAARKRANYIVVTKSLKILSPIIKDEFLKKLKPYPGQHVIFSTFGNYELLPVFPKNNSRPLTTNPYAIFLITGIKNPSPIEEELRLRCMDLRSYLYPDHHPFSDSQIHNFLFDFDRYMVPNKIIVTTEKDLPRLLYKASEKLKKYPIFVIKTNILFHHINGENFEQKIVSYVKENRKNKKIHQKENQQAIRNCHCSWNWFGWIG
ncbi:MAG: tetraacyldisaccharide 4'-kinase [Bacteroidales bacterium]|nr:tetraacyldisaccharide 4'-kinase [Bacteroidales bacterium]